MTRRNFLISYFKGIEAFKCFQKSVIQLRVTLTHTSSPYELSDEIQDTGDTKLAHALNMRDTHTKKQKQKRSLSVLDSLPTVTTNYLCKGMVRAHQWNVNNGFI